MSEQERLASEKLVQVYKARDEWQGNLIVGYLQSNGIEATLQDAPAVPPLDTVERLSGKDQIGAIYVLEEHADQAKQLVQEFLAPVLDERILEQTAAQKLKVDKETIGRLRGAILEERRTFNALRWIGGVFLFAAVLLWNNLPPEMKEPMHFERGDSSHLAILVVFYIALIAAIIANLSYIALLDETLWQCSPEPRRPRPWFVMLMFVPWFNLFWHFVVVIKVSNSLSDEFRRRGIEMKAHPGLGLGISMCSFECLAGLAWLPGDHHIALAGLFVGVICWFFYWGQIERFSSVLASTAPAKR